MAYIRKEYYFDDSIEVEKNYNGRYGAPGVKRKKKKKATPEEIVKQNLLNKIKKVKRLIKWNFRKGDYWSTFTYPRGQSPPIEEGKKNIERFVRNLRGKYKRLGCDLKYIIRTEIGSKGALHHHVILNRINVNGMTTDTLLAETWKYGHIRNQLLYEEGDYRELAAYITKPGDEKTLRNYTRSRNLIQKEPVKRLILRKEIEEEPKPRKGYYIDKNSIAEGTNPTGHKYQHYTMIKVKRRE
jgi:hypothetical protein